MASKTSVYRHIVFFEYKNNASPEDIQSIVNAFTALQTIPQVMEFERGIANESTEPPEVILNTDHVFFLTFRDRAAFEIYFDNPDHQEFVMNIAPEFVERAQVYDYTQIIVKQS